MPEFTVSSTLAVGPATLLEALTMESVNRELAPLVRMTAPPGWRRCAIGQWEAGRVLFSSWILLFGVVPIDRHTFRLERILPGEGFDEASSSWANRQWRHSRRISAVPGRAEACTVTDRVSVTGRLPWLTAVLMPTYRLVFRHRHARLRRWHGVG
jgi:hypothetical protein